MLPQVLPATSSFDTLWWRAPTLTDASARLAALTSCTACMFFAGHSCWGILNAPATGEALAELILQGAAQSSNLKAFDPARFARAAKRR